MKKYYYAGSLCIAMRVGINLTATGLTWLFSDHLGSVIRTQSASSSTVYTNRTYKPWGEQSSGTSPTTRGYTGQIEEPNLGGIYFYNARWYDPAVSRFMSADSIIPDLYNPQSWDRYSYVRNNPVNFNDPTGYKACSSDGNSFDSCTDPLAAPINWSGIEKIWGIKFAGQDSNGISTWTEQRKIWALGAVVDTGRRQAEGTKLAASTAFRMTYAASNPLIFLFGTSLAGHYLSTICGGIGSGGCTSNDVVHKTLIINFWDTTNQYSNGTIFMRNVVHELGHAFNSVFSNNPATEYSKKDLGRNLGGFAGGLDEWQFAYTNADSYSEIFADSFVGWTYNTWGNDLQGYGARRQSFMNTTVPYYMTLLLEP